MRQHHYGYPPEDEDVAEDFVDHFYKKPLPRPHSMACRDHEPGMLVVYRRFSYRPGVLIVELSYSTYRLFLL